MDAGAEIERNPASKHQIQPDYQEWSRLTRDGTVEPVSRDHFLRRERGQEMLIFPVQLTSSRIGNLTPCSAICDDHTCIHSILIQHTSMKIVGT